MKFPSYSLCAALFAASALAFGCAGAKDNELDDDTELPDDVETSAGTLAVDAEARDAVDDVDRDHKKGDRDGHRKHTRKLFKLLDRLDGDKDGRIVIASLPAKAPPRLIAKLHEIDADGDGAVTKEEARAKCKARRESK